MLQVESSLIIADNTGAKVAQIFRIIKGSNATVAKVGDVVVVAIKDATPTAAVKKWEVSRAIIVRQKKELRRPDGTYIRFGDNAAVLLSKNEKGEMAPIGKRVFGPVARELREKYRVITNMAEDVI